MQTASVLHSNGDAYDGTCTAACRAGDITCDKLPTDVTDPAQMRALADAAASTFGGIDVWINNAGTSLWGPFESIPLESQARLVEIDLSERSTAATP